MTDKTQRYLALGLTALLAACAAVAGLADVPASWHRVAEVILSIGGAIGTALLPGVRLPGAPPAPAAPPASPTAPEADRAA